MASRSNHTRQVESSFVSRTKEEEKICNQIREHLLEATALERTKSLKLYSCKCGFAIYSKSRNCWKIHHKQHAPDSEEKGPTPLAELYYSDDKSRNSRPIPNPPTELVQSILMCQELQSWVNKGTEVVRMTSGGGNKDASSISKMDNLRFQVSSDISINFAVFLSLLNKQDEGRALLGRMFSIHGNKELWKMEKYQGWTVVQHFGEEKKSILEKLGHGQVHITMGSSGSESTVRPPKRRFDTAGSNRLSIDSLSSLPPPKSQVSALAHDGVLSGSKGSPSKVDGRHRLGREATANMTLENPLQKRRPPALDPSSESAHTLDDEAKNIT